MCELFGMNSNQPTDLTASLSSFRHRGGETADNPDGWGVAYRLSCGFMLHKAPGPAARSKRFAQLSETVRSDLVIAHVRKANPPTAHVRANTHPFVRECCGRQWVFAHNGKVPELLRSDGCCYPTSSVPAGETDSEHAFCYLLDEIASVFNPAMTKVRDAWLDILAAKSGAIATYGRFNFLMSDGEYLIAYGHDRLHWLERQCGDLKLVLLATEPLTENEPWRAFKAGELRIYRHGELISHLQTQPRLTKPPVSPQQDTKAVMTK